MTGDAPDHLLELGGGWGLWRLCAVRSAGLPFDLLAPFAADHAPASGQERRLDATTRAAMDLLLLDDAFRNALTWQNPELIDNWVGDYVTALRAGDRPQQARMGRRAALVARYAQRYCAKNDTIGFFGPVAWARWGAGPTNRRGTMGLRGQAVYFEVWAMQAVARAWNADPTLRDHLPVRLDPACSVAGGLVRRPHRSPLTLDPVAAELLAALPAASSVGDLWAQCGLQAGQALALLEAGGVVRCGFRVPLDSAPETHLRQQVVAVKSEPVRRRLLAVLDELDRARAAVAAQPGQTGDPARLRSALAEVDECLARAAGGPARPAPGLAPGGRTAVYTDCRRDLDVTLGDDLLAGLATPLGVLLDSARWLAGQVGAVVEVALRQRYRGLRSNRSEVTLADLQFAAADVLMQGSEVLTDVVTDFQLRWAEILPAGAQDGHVSAEDARGLADVLFRPSGRLWTSARAHSPDLMLRSTEDGPRWVLGELHVALNTLESRVFRTQADDVAELVRAVGADLPAGRVVPVYPSSARAVSARTYPPLALDPPGRYRYWSYGADDGHPSGAPSTPATAILVGERDGELLAMADGDGWQAPVLECFGEFLTAQVVNLFAIRAPARFAPRVSIGDLVVARRSWRIPGAELAAMSARTGRDRLGEWARRERVPRHVFVHAPTEPKPFYVDFSAPALVDNLLRVARRVTGRKDGRQHMDVVEMLPAPDELWLADTRGQRYTSEFRLVATDRRHVPETSDESLVHNGG